MISKTYGELQQQANCPLYLKACGAPLAHALAPLIDSSSLTKGADGGQVVAGGQLHVHAGQAGHATHAGHAGHSAIGPCKRSDTPRQLAAAISALATRRSALRANRKGRKNVLETGRRRMRKIT